MLDKRIALAENIDYGPQYAAAMLPMGGLAGKQDEMVHEQAMASQTGRIIIVSNRLPFTVKEEASGLQFVRSVGGLATGLSSYLESFGAHLAIFPGYTWVGWPGSSIAKEKREEIRAMSLSDFNALPVFLSKEDIEKFYQGFCNKTIWPLFHSFQVYTDYNEDHWLHYIDVNRTFCQALLEFIEPDDTVWIHDYHLMLLPQMIRERLPAIRLGFFLHIPFPNFEIFRLLPGKWRRAILEGLLGADLIGFHTNDYKQDFIRCVMRFLGYEASMGEMVIGNRVVKVDSFPMGIDFKKYHGEAVKPDIQQKGSELDKRLGGAKAILSVDRLDYTKGIANRLEAFEIFLETNHSWHGKVILILIVVPSRIAVEHYEMMKNQIEALVGRINGRFGSISWTPIIYMFRALTFSPLVALYSACPVALITPLRDGMNLIAKEYIASRSRKTGVLILSEMAGASKELGEAVIINPNSREEIAQALLEALEMPEEEQIRRNKIMQDRLKRYDVVRWAGDFIDELGKTKYADEKYFMRMLSPDVRERLIRHYRSSSRRLLLLDYDGTLVPFATAPNQAVPDDSLLKILGGLTGDSRNKVVIISGRNKSFLEEWFSTFPISLVAEHGAWLRDQGEKWQMAESLTNDWKYKIKPLLETYVDRVPSTFLEEKDFAFVWHYRASDPEAGKLAAQELTDNLLTFTANIDVHVTRGNKIVEVRAAGVNKGIAALRFLAKDSYDFILCIGDDNTDEDLFGILPEKAYSIRVGVSGTCAKYNIADSKDVIKLLEEIAS